LSRTAALPIAVPQIPMKNTRIPNILDEFHGKRKPKIIEISTIERNCLDSSEVLKEIEDYE
tara:strand:+ start:25 stop:207 length:183 start_codon:yes stop_codon:yes gene_type:complete